MIASRPRPENSVTTSEIGVVSASWPRSIARSVSTTVIAFVVEKRLNTESFRTGRLRAESAWPTASCSAR